MKINRKIAIGSVSAAAVAGLGISAGIALAAPAAATSAASADAGLDSTAQAHATVKPKQPAPRKADQWITVRAGQTLKTIAGAHHMSWEAIYATPPNTRYLRDHAKLAAGVRLRLPADPQLRTAQYAAMQAARREAARDEAARDRTQAAAAAQSAATAQATQPAAQAQSQPLTAGMSAFEQCVAWRESSDNPTASSAGLFGILPATWQSLGYSGTAGTSSVALQKVAFNRLYAQDGTSPWAPYDGC